MATFKINLVTLKRTILLWLMVFSLPALAQTQVQNLQVEYQTNPIGLDSASPRFSWQLVSSSAERGVFQSGYQIKVIDEQGTEVWNSGKVETDVSLGIAYAGRPLQPVTRYTVSLAVWDHRNTIVSTSSWFETGLLNPDPSLVTWDGAQWIGGGDEDMVLASHYLSVFKLAYALQLDKASKSTKAAFVFGANDRRLMDRNKNIQGVQSGKNQNYIAFELDIEGVNEQKKEGFAQFKVYRVGYAQTDRSDVPFKSFNIPQRLINSKNKYDKHQFYVECNFGIFEVYLNEIKNENKLVFTENPNPSPFADNGLNLNPVGKGNDYISFPMVADIGFWLPQQQKASFADVTLRNYRTPYNVLFNESPQNTDYQGIFKEFADNSDLHIVDQTYHVNGGTSGVLILANPSKNGTPMLRTSFTTSEKKIRKARLYITARGIYEAYLNGIRVGNDYFNPGLTQYNKTQMYQTYDVTALVTQNSKNALGIWLSEGWWSGNITYRGENWNYFGDRQSVLSKLVITYSDGSEKVVASNDTDWKLFTEGPIRYGSFFQGEIYDAAKEAAITNWNNPDFDDTSWKPAVEVPLKGTAVVGSYQDPQGRTISLDYETQKITGQIGENAKQVKTLTALRMNEVRPGVYVYDMGQNMVGVPQITLQDGKPKDTITLRFAEVLYPDLPEYGDHKGMVMLENIRAALAQDLYIRKGGVEVIQPRFTFHGYRYIEITGINAPLLLENVKGLVISSVGDLASSYETSNDLVNKLWENVTWSFRGNFLSIPTDTPARNERMGWSGDINVFAKAATFLGAVQPFLRRHLIAMRDMQAPTGRFTDVAPVGGGFGGTLWGSAGIVIPWELYQQYGDVAVLKEHYDAMKAYVAFLATKENENGVLDEGPLGDWLSPENDKNDNTAMWNAYQVYNLDILAKTATILDKNEEATEFRKQYNLRKTFFNQTYVHPVSHKTQHTGHVGFRFDPPPPEDQRKKLGDLVDTQASYAIPLALNVFNEVHKPAAVNHLVDAVSRTNRDDLGKLRPEYSLMTGFIGTASLNEALSANGKHAEAYRVLQQTSYPSWLYSVVNGATTIWERLNSYTVEEGFGGNNSMNSFNHYSFGAVLAWMYNYSLGIQRDPDNPGFKHFMLRPTPDPDGVMTWAKGYYDSTYGRIESEWRKDEKKLRYLTTIPANTTATLYLPATALKNVTESGKKIKKSKGVTLLRQQENHLVFELSSGSFVFEVVE
ncbi:family 78 glycoside hydrolase catalytic domain [Arenibacter sp. GZD96]|uniref:family 78 glycoside hydrolase catalytic domain n=1 Tax=Aurantibrevibacter litoralis TaxID=3106030 RepID=UPI002AFFF058|nr:family 78 glycoside hydrolase catalytic domain [Arenibacter sp. GZD-96]MEA1786017.1 family 78 glycoside hydrolase catalytic domain [Arenibacter sp. GZD-96]